ncbi:MAG TPA: HDOD domain-containing protein [Desulfuromonadales bacterium]|nr:HDOD domain-containing protein [Desulfuromonadales bacterium]
MSISPDFKMLLAQVPIELPVFNPVALELLQLLENPGSHINIVVDTINKDQALSALVLRMANSAAFSGLEPSETIKASAIRLGTKQICNLAMAASQAALHTSDIAVVNDIMRELWLHSNACAVGCWTVAMTTSFRPLADQAYLAGLLHDIGKLYILKGMERMSPDGHGFELERKLLLEVFTEMHVELGVRLMNHWNIPALYQAVVADHHLEEVMTQNALLDIVRLVNFNSRRLHMSLNPAVVTYDAPAPEYISLEITEFDWANLEETMIKAGKF